MLLSLISDAVGGLKKSFRQTECFLFLNFHQLQRANSNWKAQWDKVQQSHQIQLNELHSKLVIDEREVSDLKSRLAAQSSEFESRILEMKRHLGEEEVSEGDSLQVQWVPFAKSICKISRPAKIQIGLKMCKDVQN